MPRPGEEFETLLYEVCTQLVAPGIFVQRNERIWGSKSKRMREIDLSLREGSNLMIFDAKDHGDPVGTKLIEAALGLASDVQASQPAVVSGSGFSKPAINRAKSDSMDLFTIIDPSGQHRWQRNLTVDCLCLITLIGSVKLSFTDSSNFFDANPGLNPLCMKLYDHQYNLLGPVHDLLLDQLELPKDNVFLLEHPLSIHPALIADQGAPGGFREIMLKASLKVRTEAWQGSTALVQGRGLYDEIRKQATLPLRDLVYDSVDVSTLRQNNNWKRVHKLDDQTMQSKLILEFKGISQEFCSPHQCC